MLGEKAPRSHAWHGLLGRTRPHKDSQLSPSVEKVATGASCTRVLRTKAQMVPEHCQRARTSCTSSMMLVWQMFEMPVPQIQLVPQESRQQLVDVPVPRNIVEAIQLVASAAQPGTNRIADGRNASALTVHPSTRRRADCFILGAAGRGSLSRSDAASRRRRKTKKATRKGKHISQHGRWH